MMPTTSAASTPSRSAIRNAESTSCPAGLVVSQLQLPEAVYPTGTLCVNRTNSVRFPHEPLLRRKNRLFSFLQMGVLRLASSVIVSSLFLFSQASAQSQMRLGEGRPFARKRIAYSSCAEAVHEEIGLN